MHPRTHSGPKTKHDAGARGKHLQGTVDFLRSIGLQVHEQAGATGFAKNVRISCGTLLFDPAAKASVLLHEAGHLALLPERFRAAAHDDLKGAFRAMDHWYEARMKREGKADVDDWSMRSVLNCSDPEVTAWAWAAGIAAGLPVQVIIDPSEYSGSGKSVRLALSMGAWAGIHGLQAAGWCTAKRIAQAYPERKLAVYPTLNRWLQHDVED